MVQKYLNLEEAARLLGISTDELNQMRERNQLFAFRDGGTWKFRQEDLQKAAEKRGMGVISDQLEGGSELDRTSLGVPADESGTVHLETAGDASESAVLGGMKPRKTEPGTSRTFVGNVVLSESESSVRLETGEKADIKDLAAADKAAAVLGDELDSAERDMQTVLGSKRPTGAKGIVQVSSGDSGILSSGDSGIVQVSSADSGIIKSTSSDSSIKESGDSNVLGEMLDATEEDKESGTVLGSTKKGAKNPAGDSKVNIKLEVSEDSDSAELVLDREMREVKPSGSGTGGTVLGNAEELTDDVESIPVKTAEEQEEDQVLFGTRSGDDTSASRTVIGLPSVAASESDVRLEVRTETPRGGDVKISPRALEADDSDVKLTPARGSNDETINLGNASDLAIDDDSMSIDLGDNEGSTAAAPAKKRVDRNATPAPMTRDADDDITLDLGGDEALEGDDELVLSSDQGGSDITIASSQSGIGVGGCAADSGLSLEQPLDLVHTEAGGSGVDLEADDEDEFVLSSSGSDITRRPGESGIGIGGGESGIALASLADSGISLETPLDLGGGGSGMGGDFLLTPVDEGDGEDSDDSGSQVIALDADADGLDEGQATMLGAESEPAAGTMLEAEEPVAAVAGGRAVAPMRGGAAAMQMPGQQVMIPQSVALPFSGLQVTSLTFCLLFLIMAGIMTFDLMTNMWTWGGASTYTSSIMDWILNLIEGPS